MIPRAGLSQTARGLHHEGPASPPCLLVCLSGYLTQVLRQSLFSKKTSIATIKPIDSVTISPSLVPRPICGRGKNGLVAIVCACAEYPTIHGVSDRYINSPCNFPLYLTHMLVYCGLACVSSLYQAGQLYVLRMLR